MLMVKLHQMSGCGGLYQETSASDCTRPQRLHAMKCSTNGGALCLLLQRTPPPRAATTPAEHQGGLSVAVARHH
jgi:hypothetical protein